MVSGGFRICLRREDARRLLYLVLACDLLLAAIYLAIRLGPDLPWGPLDNLFDVDREQSIPTWFSSAQLLVVGLLLLAVVRERLASAAPITAALAILAAVFLFLSLDESASIHEKITAYAFRREIHWLTALSFRGNHGVWIAVYAVLTVAVVALSQRGLRQLWQRARVEMLWLGAGFAVFGGGAVGLEIVSYQLREHARLFVLELAAEELLEMAGVSLILYGVMMLAIRLEETRACN